MRAPHGAAPASAGRAGRRRRDRGDRRAARRSTVTRPASTPPRRRVRPRRRRAFAPGDPHHRPLRPSAAPWSFAWPAASSPRRRRPRARDDRAGVRDDALLRPDRRGRDGGRAARPAPRPSPASFDRITVDGQESPTTPWSCIATARGGGRRGRLPELGRGAGRRAAQPRDRDASPTARARPARCGSPWTARATAARPSASRAAIANSPLVKTALLRPRPELGADRPGRRDGARARHPRRDPARHAGRPLRGPGRRPRRPARRARATRSGALADIMAQHEVEVRVGVRRRPAGTTVYFSDLDSRVRPDQRGVHDVNASGASTTCSTGDPIDDGGTPMTVARDGRDAARGAALHPRVPRAQRS